MYENAQKRIPRLQKFFWIPAYEIESQCLGAVQKRPDARRAKSRTARHIFTYVERCGLQCNTADHVPFRVWAFFNSPSV